MTKPVKNLPASIHARLKNLARERNRPFQEILQYYAMERFLYRLSQSEYRRDFVLKGGLIFLGWGIPLRRVTRDIDFHSFTTYSLENVEAAVSDICFYPVQPDGITFDPTTVTSEKMHEGAERQAIRVRFVGFLGRARVHMRMDVGFSDVLVPAEIEIDYPTLLDLPPPRLREYAHETVIAEKLEAVVDLGSLNSRMKDFHDLWNLAQTTEIHGTKLVEAIQSTFSQRGTSIPADIPVGLSDEFAQDNQLSWTSHVKKKGAEGIEDDFSRVIEALRPFLLPALRSAFDGSSFNATWKSSGGWIRRGCCS